MRPRHQASKKEFRKQESARVMGDRSRSYRAPTPAQGRKSLFLLSSPFFVLQTLTTIVAFFCFCSSPPSPSSFLSFSSLSAEAFLFSFSTSSSSSFLFSPRTKPKKTFQRRDRESLVSRHMGIFDGFMNQKNGGGNTISKGISNKNNNSNNNNNNQDNNKLMTKTKNTKLSVEEEKKIEKSKFF